MRLIPCFLLLCGVAGFAADEPVTYESGCLAKIYVIGKSNDPDDKRFWPVQAIPDTPGEVIRLREGPNIEAKGVDPENENQPNRLVSSKIGLLSQVNFYVVEYEGWVGTKAEGVYTLSAQLDDPVEIFIEGRSVLKLDFSSNINDGSKQISTAQVSVKLAASKYYHVSIVAKQRWWVGDGNPNNCFSRGAHLKIWLANPAGKPSLIPLCLPSKIAGP